MKYLVVKVKDKDLFFNADEAMGEYICSTPMLLDKDQADSIMRYCPSKIWLYGDSEDEWINKDQLEVKEVTLNFC